MLRHVLIAASIITALLLFGVLGLAFWHRGLELKQTQTDLASRNDDLASMRLAAETNAARVAALVEELDAARARAAELEHQNEETSLNQRLIEAEMRRTLESKDITISELQGKLTVNILDRILFDSGEATLRPEGQEVLMKIANVLAQFPTRQAHVIGHTDNVPIRASARHRYPSNWELSTARATAAVRFLSEQAGVDPRRLGAVGYGEFRPVADNNTAEGRALNRRIAIVVLSEELVGSDAVAKIAPLQLRLPPDSSATQTNSPPPPTKPAAHEQSEVPPPL